jgi:hypothetical protein
MPPPRLTKKQLEGADFLDLGASKGGSLRFCTRRFGGRGIGVDIDEEKVRVAREAGFDVLYADASDLGLRNVVRFVAAMDFFEHLPDVDTTRAILRSAAEAATEFLFIRHPSFEGEHYLRQMGLVQYWHNWSGHPNHLRVSDYCELFDELGLRRYAIEHVERVRSTAHPSIIPVGHRNSHEYDLKVHGAKPETALAEPVWRMQHIYVQVGDMPARDWERITRAGRQTA